MKQPLVSVPITSYNHAKYIEAAIVSVLEQDYENLQVLVLDDVSTDNSKEILLELSSKFPGRLELHFNEENLGVGGNRRKGFDLCRGELIAYLDGDDEYLPGKIQKQVELMLLRPDIALCYHNVEVFDTYSGYKVYDWDERFGSGDGDVRDLIRFGQNLSSLSFFFRREHMPASGFDALGIDWLFFIQTLINGGGKYLYIDEVLARHRRHKNNWTWDWDKKFETQNYTLSFVSANYPQFEPEVRLRRADTHLLQTIFNSRKKNIFIAARHFYRSLVLSFPKVWTLLRLPLREFVFWIKKGRKLDPLVRSLLDM